MQTLDPKGNATTYQFDALGRRARTFYADNHYSTVEFDSAGRLLRTQTRDGYIIENTYAADSHRVISRAITRPGGTVYGTTEECFEYNARGQLIEDANYELDSASPTLVARNRYYYNSVTVR